MFKLVHYEARTVGKRAVWIRLKCLLVTGRNEVVAKVIFLHQTVCHSVHRGVCLSACWDTTPPPGADPPGSRLRHTVNEWPVRILLECLLVVLSISNSLFSSSVLNSNSKGTFTHVCVCVLKNGVYGNTSLATWQTSGVKLPLDV